MKTLYTGEEVADNTITGMNVTKYPRLDGDGKPLPGHGVYALSQGQIDDLAAINTLRYERQVSDKVDELRRNLSLGTVTVNGATVKCDDSTLGAISSTIMFFDKLGGNAPASVAWKAENGFFDLTPSQVNQLGLAVFSRRQKIFSSAKTVESEVADGTLTTLDEVIARYNELISA